MMFTKTFLSLTTLSSMLLCVTGSFVIRQRRVQKDNPDYQNDFKDAIEKYRNILGNTVKDNFGKQSKPVFLCTLVNASEPGTDALWNIVIRDDLRRKIYASIKEKISTNFKKHHLDVKCSTVQNAPVRGSCSGIQTPTMILRFINSEDSFTVEMLSTVYVLKNRKGRYYNTPRPGVVVKKHDDGSIDIKFPNGTVRTIPTNLSNDFIVVENAVDLKYAGNYERCRKKGVLPRKDFYTTSVDKVLSGLKKEESGFKVMGCKLGNFLHQQITKLIHDLQLQLDDMKEQITEEADPEVKQNLARWIQKNEKCIESLRLKLRPVGTLDLELYLSNDKIQNELESAVKATQDKYRAR